MITVELKHVRFFGYHGLYSAERKTGNEFIVDLAVSYEPENDEVAQKGPVINYVELFQLVKNQIDAPVDLLETLVINIAGEIKLAYPQTKRIHLSLSKLHPPIQGFSGNVSVAFQREY